MGKFSLQRAHFLSFIIKNTRDNLSLRYIMKNENIINLQESYTLIKKLPINFLFHLFLLKDMYLLKKFSFINSFYYWIINFIFYIMDRCISI